MSRLTQVEREIEGLAFEGDEGRLAVLLRERGELIGQLGVASAEELRGHYERGRELAERLRRERTRLVEAWSASAHERQLLSLFEARPEGPARLAELG